MGIAISFVPFFVSAETITELQSKVDAINNQIEQLQAKKQALNDRIAALRQSPSGEQATVTFSPEGGTIVAGKDSWTFTLSHVTSPNSVLSVRAWQNNVLLGTFSICTSDSSGSCTKTRIVPLNNVGTWKADVLVNGASIGKTVNFTVVAPEGSANSSPATQSPSPAVSGIKFHFSQNGKTIIAGQSSWTLNVDGLKPGDEIQAHMWKNGNDLGSRRLCSYGYCVTTEAVTNDHIGTWEIELSVRRNGADTVIAERGTIKFTVTTPPTGPTTASGENCSVSLSATSVVPGGQETLTVVSNPPYRSYVWCGTNTIDGVKTQVRQDDGTLCRQGGTTNYPQTYTLSTPGEYARYAVVSLPGGSCTTNTVTVTVQSQSSSAGSAASVFDAVKKQFETLFAYPK